MKLLSERFSALVNFIPLILSLTLFSRSSLRFDNNLKARKIPHLTSRSVSSLTRFKRK